MLLSNNPDMKVMKIRQIATLVTCLLILVLIFIYSAGLKGAMTNSKELQYEFSKLASFCNKRLQMEEQNGKDLANLPTIYCITPTYARYVQEPELTRLAQTLCLVPNIHWIIIEDANERTDFMINFLKDIPCLMPYTHLYASTPVMYKITKGLKWHQRPRGVSQRNEGLKWLRENLDVSKNRGVVYFMDDDNTYSVRLFKEMSKIKRVGVWPVGLVGGSVVEKPVVSPETGKIVGFNSIWEPQRPFPIDMAAFAINLTLILENPEAMFSYDAKPGYQETEILRHVTSVADLEPLADNCTKIYVWHTRTEKPKMDTRIRKQPVKI